MPDKVALPLLSSDDEEDASSGVDIDDHEDHEMLLIAFFFFFFFFFRFRFRFRLPFRFFPFFFRRCWWGATIGTGACSGPSVLLSIASLVVIVLAFIQ